MADKILHRENFSSKEPANQLRSLELWSEAKPNTSDLQNVQSKQMHQQGFIDFSKADDIWAKRIADQDKNYHRDIAAHIKDAIKHGMMDELQTPKDGDNLSLKQILTDYKTPFIDAYHRSKQLSDGAPGKSQTLETLVDRLQACPWADKIRVKFDASVPNPEYDPRESTITINPKDSATKQLQDFTHESYHASHQKIAELYSPSGKLSSNDYGNLKGDIEAHCFESEVKVTDELRKLDPSMPSPMYAWATLDRTPQPNKDLCDLYNNGGFKGLKAFILDEARTRMMTDDGYQLLTYREYWQQISYPKYEASYDNGRSTVQQYLNGRPDAINY
jgi:hypothetical protein